MSLWRSLRVRLTAAFLALASLALAVTAVTLVLFVEQSSIGMLDAVLLEEATTLADLVDLPPERLAAAVRDVGNETDLGPGKFVSVAGADGAMLAASRPLPPSVSGRRPRALAEPRVATTGEDDAMFRVAWAPTKTGGLVAVGVRATQEIRFFQRARWAISILAGALLAILGGGAWAITGRATRELDRLAGEITNIEAGSLERRLSVRRTYEVDRLVGVLNRVLARLERSVAELRRFTADAAHELRTPLAAMRARLEVALCREGETVPRDVVVEVLEQTEHVGRLAEDLLMLARLEGGAVRAETMEATVDLTRLVDEVGSAMAPLAEEEERPFRWSAVPGVLVRGSEPLLKRVLLNLVDNAFRHTPARAPVEIEVRRDGSRAVLEVRDEGSGVDPLVLPHVFERFRHGSGGGTGLGLALVREIVECHHGRVALEPGASGGLRARVSLDLAPARPRVWRRSSARAYGRQTYVGQAADDDAHPCCHVADGVNGLVIGDLESVERRVPSAGRGGVSAGR